MNTYLILLLSVFSFTALAQDAPVKWATQETFFEDLTGKDLPSFNISFTELQFKAKSILFEEKLKAELNN